VVHAIYPREYRGEADNLIKLDVEKPFASVYLFCGESQSSGSISSSMAPQVVLREGGFDFKHFEAWRFRKVAGMTYGTSPAIDARYDLKMLNVSSKAMADTEQMNARPPIYTDLGMKGRLRIAPGGVTYGIGGNKPEPIFQGTNYQISMEGIERRARVIREHFKTDFFMAISQLQKSSRDRTATEIMEIKSESAAVLGSIVGRVQSEFLHPLVENTIRMEAQAGRLPVPPEGIDKNINLNLSFIGPLAQAQRKYLVKQGLEAGITAVGNMAGLFQDPTLLMNVDKNYAARKLMIVSGYPQEGLVDQKDAEDAQEAYAQGQAQAMQAQQELEAQKNLPAMGKAPEDGSPLASMMGKGR